MGKHSVEAASLNVVNPQICRRSKFLLLQASMGWLVAQANWERTALHKGLFSLSCCKGVSFLEVGSFLWKVKSFIFLKVSLPQL